MSQNKIASSTRLMIPHISRDFAIGRLDDPAWNGVYNVLVSKYWSAKVAPKKRQFWAGLLWSDTAFYVRFENLLNPPLIVSERPDVSKKTIGLWDRDVCEIFIAPDTADRNRYFEFEIAPTGEWVDLGIQWSAKKRTTDLEYSSGMESAVTHEAEKIVMAIKIPWTAFGKTPKSGDVWLGNLFRCVGKGPTRGYLAWQPTKTTKPNFHVPEAFGEFQFTD